MSLQVADEPVDQIDRWSEFSNIGAGHAAGALGQLVGEPIRMQVPQVIHRGGREAALPVEPAVGIVFGVEGGIGGHFAVFLSHEATGPLLRALLGDEVSLSSEDASSAFAEVGNVMASHALSAIADLLGTKVLPSVPELDLDAPGPHFAERFGTHTPRIENLLIDAAGSVLGALVWLPEH